MSSLPTHSTSGSLSASTGPASHSDGSSVPTNSLNKGAQPSFPPWVSGNSTNLDCSYRAGLNNSGLASKANGDTGSPLSADEPISHLSESSGGIRSPITTDESLIEHLEQRLLERETELQELQVPVPKKHRFLIKIGTCSCTCSSYTEKQTGEFLLSCVDHATGKL